MRPAPHYFTLAQRTGNAFFPQFGDYDRDTVEQERRDMIASGEGKARDFRIVRSGDSQADIDAAVCGTDPLAGRQPHLLRRGRQDHRRHRTPLDGELT